MYCINISLTMCTAKLHFAYYKRSIMCSKTSHCYVIRCSTDVPLWNRLREVGFTGVHFTGTLTSSVCHRRVCFKSLSTTAAKETMMTGAIPWNKEHECHKLGKNACVEHIRHFPNAVLASTECRSRYTRAETAPGNPCRVVGGFWKTTVIVLGLTRHINFWLFFS